MKGRGMQTNVSHGSGLKSRFQRVGRWREERKAPSQACRQRPGSSFLQHFQILTKKPHSFSPSSPVRTLLVRLLCSSSAPKVWTYEPLHLLSSPLPSHFLYLFTIKCQSLLVRTYLSPSTFCLSSNYHLAATLLLPPLWRSVTPCSGEWAGVEASSTTRSAASFQHASCSSLSLSVSQPPLSLFFVILLFLSISVYFPPLAISLSSPRITRRSLAVWQWIVWTVHLYTRTRCCTAGWPA